MKHAYDATSSTSGAGWYGIWLDRGSSFRRLSRTAVVPTIDHIRFEGQPCLRRIYRVQPALQERIRLQRSALSPGRGQGQRRPRVAG